MRVVGEIGSAIGEVDATATTIAAAIARQSTATQDIARNVADAATAAREADTSISAVSDDAEIARKAAAEVQADVVGLAEDVTKLRRSVVRAVRESSPAVNRRLSARILVDRPGRLARGGEGTPHPVTVADLSQGGARLQSAPAMQPGERGILHIDGVAQALPFTVRNVETEDGQTGLNIAFQLDAATAAAFAGVPERLQGVRRSAA